MAGQKKSSPPNKAADKNSAGKGASSTKAANKAAGAAARGAGSSKEDEKTAAGSRHTKAKNFGWMTPSKGAVNTVTRTKGQKYAREHSIRYYVFNMHEEANTVGIVIYGERDFFLTSWLSKVGDDVIRKQTGDFDPIPFFEGTFFLHDVDGNPVKNDRGQ